MKDILFHFHEAYSYQTASNERMLSRKSRTHIRWHVTISTRPAATKLDRMRLVISSHKLQNHMSFQSCGHVQSHGKFSARSMSTKHDRAMAYEKGSLPTMVTWHNTHVMSKKLYTSIYTKLMATKLDKVLMAYYIGPPRTSLITWSYVVS